MKPGSSVIPLSALLLLLLGVATQTAAAQGPIPPALGPVILTDSQQEYILGLHLDLLEDPGGDLTIEQVASPAYDEKFIASQSEVPILGFTDAAYWVRVKIQNETRSTNNWFLDVLYSNLQYIDLYTAPPGSNEYSVRQAGSLRSPTVREIPYPRAVFSLMIHPQTHETIYMRIQSGTSMTIHLKLLSQSAFYSSFILQQLTFGIFFGILIGLLFYNLFVFLSLREVNYLFYAFLLASMLLHEASYNGYLETYLIPNLYSLKSIYHPILFSLMIASILLFPDSFLELTKRSPKIHWMILICLTIGGILILILPFVSYRRIAVLLGYWALFSLLVIATAILYNFLRGKFRSTPLFTVAWFALVLFILDLLLVRLGHMTSTTLSETIYRLGILLVAISLSISLADRVNQLKSETESAYHDLEKSELRLSQILDAMPLAVLLYTKDHKPRYGNRRTYDMLADPTRGIRPDINAGRTLAQAIEYYSLRRAGSADSYPLEKLPVYSALNGQPAYADDMEIHRGDEIIPLEMWASPIVSEDGDIESAVAVFQDIRQRKEAEALLLEYQEHLESLVENRTEALNIANKELHLRLEWLAAVNFVNQMIAHSANFTEIHETIAEIIKNLFASQDSFIAELGIEIRQLKILAHSGNKAYPGLNDSSLLLPENIPSIGSLDPRKPIIISREELDSLSGPVGIHARAVEIQSIVFIPLQVREKVLGFLGLELGEEGRTITNEESNLLSIFSTDIAQLIEDARLFEQVKLLVAAEERNRLARELHDSVAQGLYSISLFLNATLLALEANKPEVVKQHLEELNQLSREAMSDMRLLIFELRPPILEKSGLAAALQSRLESVETRAGFEAHFEAKGDFRLSPDQEGELYRIAQEALNNVLKHAHASKVSVQLIGQDGDARLTIEDDGIGFDPLTIEQGGGQGFRNMRERAATIGARCSFESVPDQGTKITIEVNE